MQSYEYFFFVQAYRLSAYALKYKTWGGNHNATLSTLGVLYFHLGGRGAGSSAVLCNTFFVQAHGQYALKYKTHASPGQARPDAPILCNNILAAKKERE